MLNQRFWQTHQTATSSTNHYLAAASSRAQERGREHASLSLHTPLHPREETPLMMPEEGSRTLKRKLPSEVNLDLSLSLKTATQSNDKKMKTTDQEEVDSSLSLSLFSPSKEIDGGVRKNPDMGSRSLDLSL